MRRALPLVFIAALVAISVAGQSGRKLTNPPPPKPPEPPVEALSSRAGPVVTGPALRSVPQGILEREIESIDKSTFRLADFNGKVIVLNLWATWCGPCRREVPDYEKVRKEFAGREVEFIGLSTEDPVAARTRVQKFARDFNFGFRLGWADQETAETLMNGRNVIPQTLVIAPDGHIVNHWRGYSSETSRDRLRDSIEKALTASTPTAQKTQ